MFDNLTNRLSHIFKKLSGQAYLTESNIQNMLREVRIALLEADVALPVVSNFISNLKKTAVGVKVLGSLNPSQTLVGLVHKELTVLMGGDLGKYAHEISLTTKPPAVILMVGLQGTGKTTTAAKLAFWLSNGLHKIKDQKIGKKKVLVASTDIYRPAAIDQLKILIEKSKTDFFQSYTNQNPKQIAINALHYAQSHYYDILIIDTAGRLTVDELMMKEISDISNLIKPIEVLLVVDAMQGQSALDTAKSFYKSLSLTGVILTKLDSDSRGGAALSVFEAINKPLKFVGISEKLDGLELFYPDRMAQRILGMGDILSLVERTQEKIDIEQAKTLTLQIKSNENFTLNNFRDQLLQIGKLGSINSLFEKLPFNFQKNIGTLQNDQTEKWLRHSKAILDSMTLQERNNSNLIKSSRKRRIASGSGVSIQDVNRLLNQFEQTKDLMKKMKKGGIGKMMKFMSGLSRLKR
ncbi:MAG: signal recognition particle protein [Bordetella sp.]|nr:MAG: signal recognition particle protein [Bordetella sp.]